MQQDNTAMEDAKKRMEEFRALIDKASMEGVSGGVTAFIIHNRVKFHPDDKNKNPLKDFVNLLLAEFSDSQEERDKYPYSTSAKYSITKKVMDDMENLTLLFAFNHKDAVVGMVHIAAAAGIAEFLEENREQTLKLIRKLRGLD